MTAAQLTEVILVKVVQTCSACPSQWDAWDVDGNYWYLRYRHGRGTADRQPGPDPDQWTDKLFRPDISFIWEGDPYTDSTEEIGDGYISLEEFCRRAGLNLHPQIVVLV